MAVDQYMAQLPMFYIPTGRPTTESVRYVLSSDAWCVPNFPDITIELQTPFPPSTPSEREAYWTHLGRS
jgi:hypothetical protein